MTEDEPMTRAESQAGVAKWVKITAAANVLCLLCIGVLAIMGFIYAQRNHENLCNFKVNLEQQVEATDKFLEDHPDGFGDVSAEEVKVGRDRQQAAVDSLGGLHCN